MNLDDTETRQLLYCCAAELRARAQGKPPGVQPWLTRLVRRLEQEVALASSRQDDATDQPFWDGDDDEWLGSAQVARVLGWSLRTVQRRAADLDGQKVGGAWVFREDVVRETRRV